MTIQIDDWSGSSGPAPQSWVPLFDTTLTGETTLQSGATGAVYPLWVITGPGYYPILRNVTTGKMLALRYELLRGEVVTIDAQPTKRTVLSNTNGDISASVVAGSEFWPLLRGDNDITVELGQTLPESKIVLDRRPT